MKNIISQHSTIGSCLGIKPSFSPIKNVVSVHSRFRLFKGLWITVLPVFIVVVAVITEYSGLVICWYAAFLIYFLFYPKEWRELFNDQSDF